jgi:hypothetical protein
MPDTRAKEHIMKTRGVAWILALGCGCAVLAGCTTTAVKPLATNVTPPAVGSPPPPSSVSAAEQSEAFTPYQDLGQTDDDGLAPDESGSSLTSACMATAGYGSYASDVQAPVFFAGALDRNLWYGPWGYLGTTQAAEYGFFGALGGKVGIGFFGTVVQVGLNTGQLPAAAQKAAEKCENIVVKFSNAEETGPLSQIQSLSSDMNIDMQHDPAVEKATKAWSACMAANGYNIADPRTAFIQAIQAMRSSESGSSKVSPFTDTKSPQYRTQIAMAETDADCTQSTDLAGIYFAVQAGYEQQFVNLNQVQLAAAVSDYRTAYEKELTEMQKELATAPTSPPFQFAPARRAAARLGG